MPDALPDAFQVFRLGRAVRLGLHRERQDVLQNPGELQSRGERLRVQSQDGQERHPARRGRPDSCA